MNNNSLEQLSLDSTASAAVNSASNLDVGGQREVQPLVPDQNDTNSSNGSIDANEDDGWEGDANDDTSAKEVSATPSYSSASESAGAAKCSNEKMCIRILKYFKKNEKQNRFFQEDCLRAQVAALDELNRLSRRVDSLANQLTRIQNRCNRNA